MTTNKEPRAQTHEEYLINGAQTAVVAIMATILYSSEQGGTPKECVSEARNLYAEAMRQMEDYGL